MAGTIALVGSGEFLPVMLDVDRELLAGRPPRVVVVPTAAAPEGAAVLDTWVRLAQTHYATLGVDVVPLVVRDRAEADDAGFAEQVEGAGLVYLSGGNPAYLAETLRDTAVWRAIHAAWQGGAALAGCSAGAMALTSWVPSLRPRMRGVCGLGVLPHLRVLPHFDAIPGTMRPLAMAYARRAPKGVSILGIDEDTAMVGGPEYWTVRGRQQVWSLRRPPTAYAPGDALITPQVR